MKFLRILFFLFFYNVMGSFHFKKFLGMSKNYLVNLKKDIQQIELSKSSIKNFARLHPFVSAKAVHEGLAILGYIALPGVYCLNKECKKTRFNHLKDNSKCYLRDNYIDFFNFIFEFEENIFNKDNFFSSCYFKKEDFKTHCTRFIPFPILTSLTKIYSVSRSKSVENIRIRRRAEFEDYAVKYIENLLLQDFEDTISMKIKALVEENEEKVEELKVEELVEKEYREFIDKKIRELAENEYRELAENEYKGLMVREYTEEMGEEEYKKCAAQRISDSVKKKIKGSVNERINKLEAEQSRTN